MSDFKAKMHQIRLRLGLCTRPRWGSSQRSPRPTSWIKGGLLLREEREREREGKEWEGRGGEGEGERKGREGKFPRPVSSLYATVYAVYALAYTLLNLCMPGIHKFRRSQINVANNFVFPSLNLKHW